MFVISVSMFMLMVSFSSSKRKKYIQTPIVIMSEGMTKRTSFEIIIEEIYNNNTQNNHTNSKTERAKA